MIWSPTRTRRMTEWLDADERPEESLLWVQTLWWEEAPVGLECCEVSTHLWVEHRSVKTNTESQVCGQPGVGGGDEGNIEHPFAVFKFCYYISIPYFQLNRNSKADSFKLQTLSSDSLNGGRDFQGCLHEGSDMGTHWRTAGANQEATSPAQPLGEGFTTWLWRRENNSDLSWLHCLVKTTWCSLNVIRIELLQEK